MVIGTVNTPDVCGNRTPEPSDAVTAPKLAALPSVMVAVIPCNAPKGKPVMVEAGRVQEIEVAGATVIEKKTKVPFLT
jgi:hypothetical protein